MKYTLQSCKYLLKNFFYVFPFAVIPALFLSASTDEIALSCVLENLFSGKISGWDFSHLFRAVSVLNFASWKAVAFGIIGIMATVLGVCMMMALTEKHMRIGKRTFNGIFSRINDNLLSTSGYVFFVVVLYEIWSLLTSALLYFVSRIPILPLAYAFVVIVYLAMHFALLYCINILYLWLPCTLMTGFRVAEALQYSNQLSQPVKWHILLGQTLSLFFVEALLCVCTLFTSATASFLFTSTVLYALLLGIYCVRMQIVYFDLDHIERADLSAYYQR